MLPSEGGTPPAGLGGCSQPMAAWTTGHTYRLTRSANSSCNLADQVA